MNVRDFDYIEARLLAPCEGGLEAWGRLHQAGQDELAERLFRASQAYIDACRAIRRELPHRGTTPHPSRKDTA